MASRKKLGKKKRLIKLERSSKSAPRWIDLKVFGLGRARTRSVKRFRSRHWRMNDTGE